jgi:hypothetical protein
LSDAIREHLFLPTEVEMSDLRNLRVVVARNLHIEVVVRPAEIITEVHRIAVARQVLVRVHQVRVREAVMAVAHRIREVAARVLLRAVATRVADSF